MTYGCETWSPMKVEEHMLATTERAMKQRIFGVFSATILTTKSPVRRVAWKIQPWPCEREGERKKESKGKILLVGHIARLLTIGEHLTSLSIVREKENDYSAGHQSDGCAYVEVVGRDWGQRAQKRKTWNGCARRVVISRKMTTAPHRRPWVKTATHSNW